MPLKNSKVKSVGCFLIVFLILNEIRLLSNWPAQVTTSSEKPLELVISDLVYTDFL